MSLTYRALARVDARASFPGAPSKLMCKDDSNMLGLKAKSSRSWVGGRALCSAESQIGETEASSSAAGWPWQLFSLPWCGLATAPSSFALLAAPAPSPAHCSCGSGRCLPSLQVLQWLRSAGWGLGAHRRGEAQPQPRRCGATQTGTLTVPPVLTFPSPWTQATDISCWQLLCLSINKQLDRLVFPHLFSLHWKKKTTFRMMVKGVTIALSLRVSDPVSCLS